MKHLLRPLKSIALGAAMAGTAIMAPLPGAAQATQISQILEKVDPLLTHSSSQGYLGVLVSDVDNDTASKLKLKEVRGALITLIDHDAPAGQIGLKVNDVVLELNGQRVEGADQFGRMLREIPAGRKISLLISRDGSTQTVELQLVDRKTMEQDAWNKLGNRSDPPGPTALKGFTGSGDVGTPGFISPFGSSLNVGAMVEPLTSQMADYLGVPSGIMVKQVARKSEAAAAGFKAFDVILKVGNDAITTMSDWDRALRSNAGKAVQVTILRDRKLQTVNLQVDSKHKSEVDYHELFPGLLPDGPCPMMADLNRAVGPDWADAFAAAGETWRQDMDLFQQNFNSDAFKIDPRQIEEMKKQMEQFQKNFNPDAFKIDPKQIEEMKKQMELFRKDFNPDAFKIDPRQMEEMKRQMEQMRKSMPESFNKQRLEQFKRDMLDLKMSLGQQV
jgi:membrane-associated protease RseP (regulator of RpoE activity)